jgi:hypothetical protein
MAQDLPRPCQLILGFAISSSQRGGLYYVRSYTDVSNPRGTRQFSTSFNRSLVRLVDIDYWLPW